jgi:hypothetical protein
VYSGLAICLGLILIVIYGLTFSVSPLNGEDFALSRLQRGGGFARTVLWVSSTAARQMRGWNARFGEQLAIFWLEMPAPWFTAASIVAFTAFCWSVTAVARRSVRFDQAFLTGWVVANSLCWLVWPRMEIFFWRTAVAEYLQPLVLTLLIALVFVAKDFRAAIIYRPYRVVAAGVVAFLAGMSFENVPPALLIYFAWCVIRIHRRGDEKISSLVSLASAYGLGWIALMAAPSTRVRINFYRMQFGAPVISLSYLASRARSVLDGLLSSSLELLILFACCVLFGFIKPSPSGKRSFSSLEFLFPGLVSLAGAVFAPYTEPRAFILLWVSMLVYVVWSFSEGDAKGFSIMRQASVLTLTIVAIGVAASIYGEYAKFGAQANRRIDTIVANVGREPCARGLDVPRLTSDASPRILNNRDAWVASSLSQVDSYFGCKLILK